MGLVLKQPGDLYRALSAQLEELQLVLRPTGGDERVEELRSDLRPAMATLYETLQAQIAELEASAEWDKFVVAFYGETNAGKSSVIETLRILLNEKTKIDQRAHYRSVESRYGYSPVAVEKAKADVDDAIKAESVLYLEKTAAELHAGEAIAKLEQQLADVVSIIRAWEASSSLWRRLVRRFVPLHADEAAAALRDERELAESNARTQLAEISQRESLASSARRKAQAQCAELDKCLSELEPLADGAIIGNGSPDFTRQSQAYVLQLGTAEIVLLDVPGIEGQEEQVQSEVWAAVRKAHAVFYVTSKASVPQTSDPGKKGTLEKIREHLRAQTEIWTIYNKRVTNPSQLGKLSLLSEDESDSLDALDQTLGERLGENYRGRFEFSALPAFLSAAECLVPDSRLAKSRAKFLAAMTPDDVVEKSGIHRFLNMLSENVVGDYGLRIRKANFNKARAILLDAIESLDSFRADQLEPALAEVTIRVDNALSEMKKALAAIRRKLPNNMARAVSSMIASTRATLYEKIDAGIGRKDLKNLIEQEFVALEGSLNRSLEEVLKKELARFEEDVAAAVERLRAFTQDILTSIATEPKSSSTFSVDMQMDRGLKLGALLASIVGVVALLTLQASKPVGWVTLAIGGIGAGVSVLKSVYSLIDSDFKKAQQKKAADRNLANFEARVREVMEEEVEKVLRTISVQAEDVKAVLNSPKVEIERLADATNRAGRELNQLLGSLDSQEVGNGTNIESVQDEAGRSAGVASQAEVVP